MKKKLFIICQAKGGSGKSVLTWLMAQKYPGAVYLDMDDGTSTTIKQLAYLKPKRVTFLNNTKTIDRGMFNGFLEYVSAHGNDMFVCDLGASLSEQLPHYINDLGADTVGMGLEALSLEMHIICVVGGQNIFPACMEYLDSLAAACAGNIHITVAVNGHFGLADKQQEEFRSFSAETGLTDVFHFNLSMDRNLTTQQKINDVMKDGNGLVGASVFTKIIFDRAIKNLPTWTATNS